MGRLNVDDDTPIENRVISRSLEGAQKKVEGYHFDSRKNVVQYDDVMNRHRKAIYAMRREILKQPEIGGRIKTMIDDEVTAAASSPLLTSEGFDEQLREVFNFDDPTLDRLFDSELTKFEAALKSAAHDLYNGREEAFGKEIMRTVERQIYLQVLDNLWMQHLENMDHLREGIHWMAVGQQDPLVEYRRRSQLFFEQMQQTLRHDVLRSLFHAEPIDESELNRPTETELTRAARGSVDNARQIQTEGESYDEGDFGGKSGSKASQPKAKKPTSIKKARKSERKRKTQARRRK
jgi:preprotein translocase subunit SecA